MKITTEDEAINEASTLSHNLYYEDDFTPAALRAFLNNLPPVAFVHITLKKDNNSYVYHSCSAQITFINSNLRPILIVLASHWQFDQYWVKLRPVPVRYVIYGIIEP